MTEPVSWLFAYGSLMWHPDFPYVRRMTARLYGYHRRMCIVSTDYRGSADAPGLVLGLDRGGSCQGVVFQIRDGDLDGVLAHTDARELSDDPPVYRRRILPAVTLEGTMRVFAYVVRREHASYAGGLDDGTVFRMIRDARGRRGACRDYLRNTVEHLRELGIRDRRLESIARRLGAERRLAPTAV
ncbi:gamma-glutamylcyclotransferase [Marinivivus vitaminiproducens]|uniref:gamma-glutamylcyclotransferase n=1 Tax=Marinivivus vitaminiproducens TaxID=3035935 RepID=UPI00279CE0FD|nr:gamma-glutamylcyclotransferase [Geminicoccaceae bacterium SCSIO 64248]